MSVSRKNEQASENYGSGTGDSDRKGCPICDSRQNAGTTEIYVISDEGDSHYFNVDRAKELVADGRPTFPIAERTVKKIVRVNNYEPAHLPHVDPAKPGILAQRFGGVILLDGIHRAVRCLEEDRTFHSYMLGYEESLTCVVREEIASNDPGTIAKKLRAVLGSDPEAQHIEAEIECTPEVLEQVRRLLKREENERLILRAVDRLRSRRPKRN